MRDCKRMTYLCIVKNKKRINIFTKDAESAIIDVVRGVDCYRPLSVIQYQRQNACLFEKRGEQYE